MKHEVTDEEHKDLAEKLLVIANLYAVILEDLNAIQKSGAAVSDFRHRIQPDGLIELEAFLTDNTQIRVEFTFSRFGLKPKPTKQEPE